MSVDEDVTHADTLLKHYHHKLTDWERDFLHNIASRVRTKRSLSTKQRETFDALIDKHLGGSGLTRSESSLWD